MQIFTGGFNAAHPNRGLFDRVRSALDAVTAALPVTKVIMGWSLDAELYAQTREYLADKHIALFLWLPVFAEMSALNAESFGGGAALPEPVYALDNTGRRAGANADMAWQPDENFDFLCPAHADNRAFAVRVYDRYFAGVGFDGVFLDKIRYPHVSSCFCPRCAAAYRQAGFTGHTLDGDNMRVYFDIRRRVVTEAVTEVAQQFKQRGLRIGLDVFAPFLSDYVGQDILALSGLCEFIKPMMYRATHAPAGLPYEAALLRRAGFDVAGGSFDAAFCAQEITVLSQTVRCAVYPGVEVNHIPHVAETTPAYVTETVGAYARAGEGGVVLSWNLLEAPEENWRCLV